MTDPAGRTERSEGAPPPPDALWLTAGGNTMRVVAGRDYTVGSEAGNDIRLGHASVAPRHAVLRLDGAGLTIEDLRSATGVWIGAQRIEPGQVVLAGTTVRIGEIALHVHDAAPAATVATLAFPLRRPRDPSFAELMADQLRQAPWFALSMLLHLLVFWVLYLLLPERRDQDVQPMSVVMQAEELPEEIVEDEPEEEEIEVEEVQVQPEVQDVELADLLAGADVPESTYEDFADTRATMFGPQGNLFERLRGKGGESLIDLGDIALPRAFTRTIGSLRRTGLELVFVFDSTGSMDPVLAETKSTIGRMVEVLHTLVPHAKIGIVTYRDSSSREEYLLRAVPLARDYYRSVNFMQTVRAAGGGDRPEAVADGLEAAFRQSWAKAARRVVVLIGDAPAHKESMTAITRAVRDFAHDENSAVHTIITPDEGAANDQRDTEVCFQRIAKLGRGQCLPMKKTEQLLREVLALAVGREFRSTIDEVYKAVEERRTKIDTRYLDMVRSADVAAITAELRKKEVDDGLVQALLRSRNPRVAESMVAVLYSKQYSTAARNAAAFVLQRVLGLSAPPFDAEAGENLSAVRTMLEQRIRAELTGQ